MQIRLSWYVFGPGVQSGLPALTGLGLGTFSTPVVTTAPARLMNVRRESDPSSGILDDGLTADVATSATSMGLPAGFLIFNRPNVETETVSPSEAARTAEVEALRPRLARVTTVTRLETTLTTGALTTAQRRDLFQQIARALHTYLAANGGFVLYNLSLRNLAAPRASGIGVLFGLVAIAGVLAYVNRSPSPALSAAPCAPCARKRKR